MKVLLVEDSNDKIARIVQVISKTLPNEVDVDTVIDVHSALKKIETIHYDLLIVDLQLPLRPGNEPQNDGGKILISEFERKVNLKSPRYIIAITQFSEIQQEFHDIWRVLFYSNEGSWQYKLERFVNHIKKATSIESANSFIKPTLFVEGTSDERIIKEAFNVFRPDYLDKIQVKTVESGGGASWVANQVVAWAHLLHKDHDSNPIKCVGLFDGDEAGFEGKNEVNRTVPNGSMMKNHYKIIYLKPDYAKHLIPLYQKGLKIPVCLEEMFPPQYWSIAKKNGWLTKRNDADSFLEDPKAWNKLEEGLLDHIAKLGITGDEEIYLEKFNSDYKTHFAELITELDSIEKVNALTCFERLVNDISDALISKTYN